jgi:CRP-like cAMP-binding protein
MAKIGKVRRASRGEKVLEAAGVPGRPADYKTAAVIFAQGEPGTTVMFIKKGTVKLSVVSSSGEGSRRGVTEERRLRG